MATFQGLLADAFDQIRQNAEGNVAVLVPRLLQILEILVERTGDDQRRQALRLHANLIGETAERSVPAAQDRATIEAARLQIMGRLGASGGPTRR